MLRLRTAVSTGGPRALPVWILAGTLVLPGLAPPAAARPRIDTIHLTNGDRVTGEIIYLEAATLTVRTAEMGTVDIDWPKVAALISVQVFTVQRDDGVIFFGRLDTTEEGGAVVVRSGTETAPTIPLERVFALAQAGSTLWRSRRGSLDLGWSYANASRDQTLTVGADLVLRSRRFNWATLLNSTISDEQGVERSDRHTLASSVDVPAGEHFRWFGYASFERNDDLDLESRGTAGGGLLWVAKRGARGRLLLGPGLLETRESYYGDSEAGSETSGVVRLAGEYHTFGRFGTRLSGDLSAITLLSGPSRNRVEFRGSVRQKLGSEFTLTWSPYYSYDSNPPARAALQEDWGWSTTVGWTF